MTVTPTTFREHFPEFANPTTFPDTQINYWLGIGLIRLNACRWGDLLDNGLELFIAHNLVLAAQATRAVAGGGLPGQSSGPTSSKAVDKVSVGYDVAAGTIKDGGAWNLTRYGVEFLQLSRLIGAGGIQL